MIARYDIIRQAQLYHGDLAVAALDTTCDPGHGRQGRR
mgnify:CR=1 FL=1